jgi:PTS system ascorbate-specific IIB component
MDILCVCGNGIGTSVLLKANVEQVASQMGLDVTVSTADIGTAPGTAVSQDLVLTSAQLAPELEGVTTPVKVVKNFMDLNEIKQVLEDAE